MTKQICSLQYLLMLKKKLRYIYELIRNRKLQMQHSKQKSNLAYAKTCKDKMNKSVGCKSSQGSQSHKNSNQNLYDQLMGGLQPDESGYLNQLIHKQQKKTKQIDKEKSKDQPFAERVNIINESPFQKKQNKNSKRVDQCKENRSNKKIPMSKTKQKLSKESTIKENRSKFEDQEGRNSQIPTQKGSFISNITDYLSLLKKQSHNQSQKWAQTVKNSPKRSRIEIEDDSQSQYQQEDQNISSTRYKNIVNQLHQTMMINQHLQQTIKHKDVKIQQMKQIIEQLCFQMNTIKQLLKSQHKTKKNYEYLFDDFSSKMEQVRSKSKKRNNSQERLSHTINHSKKKQRRSHQGLSLQRSSLQFRNTYDYGRMTKYKEDASSTLKKKGKKYHQKVYIYPNQSTLDLSSTSSEIYRYHNH